MIDLPATRKEAKESGFKVYFTGKACSKGHVSKRRTDNGNCVECAKVSHLKHSRANRGNINKAKRENYQSNKEDRRAARREYYKENKQAVLATNKRYYHKNKEEIIKKRREWAAKNSDKTISYSRNRYEKVRNDIDFRLAKVMREMVRRVIKNKHGLKTTSILGYTNDDLMQHIESLWLDGMSWDNYGEWHIDHIKPVIAFINEGCKSASDINALSNLQPLWAKDNLKKGGSYA